MARSKNLCTTGSRGRRRRPRAALCGYRLFQVQPRLAGSAQGPASGDAMQGSYLGSSFKETRIETKLRNAEANF